MKTEKEHKLRMTPGAYYVWCGGSCDYGHEERCSGHELAHEAMMKHRFKLKQ